MMTRVARSTYYTPRVCNHLTGNLLWLSHFTIQHCRWHIFLGSAAATTDVFHSNKSVHSSSTVWVYWQHDYLILASWIRRKSIVGNVLHVIETLLRKGENRGCGTRNA